MVLIAIFCLVIPFAALLPMKIQKGFNSKGHSFSVQYQQQQKVFVTDEVEHEATIRNLSSIMDSVLVNYDNRLRPNFYGPPVRVEVRMILRGIPSVSEVDMQFESDFYLHQIWNDSRLRYDPSRLLNYVTLDKKASNRLWQPDTYFSSEKDSRLHSATVDNEFFRWHSTGLVIKSVRLTLMSTCLMNLEHFPMDQQICSIQMGSYGMTDADVEYKWMPEDTISLGPNAGKLLPHFAVKAHRERKLTLVYFSGNYTYLIVDFLFVRSLTYYLIEVYIPCSLIVVISWFSFWMGYNAGAERMALGVTSLLTITTLLLSAHSSAPKISYVKAIDVYSGVCYAMVFASLLQSAAVCFAFNRGAKRQLEVETQESSASEKVEQQLQSMSKVYDDFKLTSRTMWAETKVPPGLTQMNRHKYFLPFRNMRIKTGLGDKAARGFFPLVFFVFNIVYWTYYLNVSQIPLNGDWISMDI